VRVADLARVPYPIVLVLGGLAIGLVPGLPDVRIAPDTVFLVFLPPLLHAAGFYASPQELRAEVRALGGLAVGIVLVSMGAVAVVAHAVIAGLSWPAAFVLGAIVAPTDPVAAAATFTRLGVPRRVALLVEGEAMINDGTALVAYRVAITAAVAGSFSAGHALLSFLGTAAGGIAVGLAAGWVELRVLRRMSDATLSIFLTVGFAYAAYIAAEKATVSGVLAAVVSGLYFGWHSHEAFDADARLSGEAFWDVLVFGLNAMLFVLLGLQFPGIRAGLHGVSVAGAIGVGLILSGVVIGVRLAAAMLPGSLAGMGVRERLVVGWSGMRGAISLAAALSVPLAVGARSEIVFVTFVVILVTLVGQGLTLPLLLRALGLEGERPWTPDEAIARLEAAQAALDRLDELRRLRELYRARFRACMAVIGGEGDGRPPPDERLRRYGEMRRELITVERSTLLGLRDEGRLRVEVLRSIQRDLDLEEARLR
jgi:monovalent cation/hydrogen antiporter